MSTRSTRIGNTREWVFHLFVLAVALAVVAVVTVDVVAGGVDARFGQAMLVGVPLIALISRFPMVLDGPGGTIEVGFDSCVLMFVLCTLDSGQALLVWAVGVLATQALSRKRAAARVFNVAVGILGGGLAAAVFVGMIGARPIETPRGLAAVALAAATYFVFDYVLSAVSLRIGWDAPLRGSLLQAGTLLAIFCFVPLDSLGYLAAVVARATPWWTLILFGVPLVTLLTATRAITRGNENARRLTVLFEAAGRAQTLADQRAVAAALRENAAELLRLKDPVQLRAEAPGESEIGVEVQLGQQRAWLVARAANRARATSEGDAQALRALAAVASDASARIELIDEMLHLARHDPLTDLPNRAILLDRVTHALERAHERHTQTVLLFLDLDGFKSVNDRFGHAAGDIVLVNIAERLRRCVGEVGTVARLGGDEFAVLLEDVAGLDVPETCARLLAAVEEGDVVGQPVQLGASIGIAFDRGHDTAPSLLRNADLAMYEAKAAGKGRCLEYQPAMGQARLERLEMLDDLRAAIQGGEISVVYQPVIEVATGRVVAVETLARWKRNGVPVRPDLFISIAEESGLIVALGESVLRRVSQDAAALVDTCGGGPSVSVNISAAQLRSPGFIDTVREAADRMGGIGLVLEITERQGVDLTGEVLSVMRSIVDMGVRFAIDDFGVGFSSISYLHDLPAQVIKADAALSQNIDVDPRARGLLRSVMDMGRTLGFDVVIEGIERDSQLDVVQEDAPYALAQGYLMHRPMPLAALLEVLDLDRAEAGAAVSS